VEAIQRTVKSQMTLTVFSLNFQNSNIVQYLFPSDDIPVAELKKERQAKLLQMKNAKTLSQKAQQDSLDSFGRRYRSESPSAKKARLTQEFYTA
jgi:hypothetical protein